MPCVYSACCTLGEDKNFSFCETAGARRLLGVKKRASHKSPPRQLQKSKSKTAEAPALNVRVPWTDPAVVSLEEASRGISTRALDLNRGFREYLLTETFRLQLTADAKKRVKAAEAKPSLQGVDLWLYHRAQRLLSVLSAFDEKKKPPTRPVLEDFAHTYATGDAWYFSHRTARPHTHGPNEDFAGPDALGVVGDAFEAWLIASGSLRDLSKASRATLRIDEIGELAFAARFLRLAAKHAPGTEIDVSCSVAVDPRVRAPFDVLLRPEIEAERSFSASTLASVRTFFKANKERVLRVVWRPSANLELLRGFAAAAEKHQIRLALDFVLELEQGGEDFAAGSVAFRALDELKTIESALSHVNIMIQTRGDKTAATPFRAWVKDQARAELLRIQLAAELTPKEGRRLLEKSTRIAALPHREVRSNFDLATIYNTFGRFCGETPLVFAHLSQLKSGRPVRREAKPSRFILFPGSATIIPMGESTELYVAAVSTFTKPSAALAYIQRFDPEDREHAARVIERLLSVQVLRFA